ncbi:FUSC family protein [Actinomadura oligospora]|uniref:FUSC family protein n=1 Tax=Actinomadura oligospora TaxID=111804 RepID=UPI000686BD82|nr:FUSC family protein [Actinomadura oligospora]
MRPLPVSGVLRLGRRSDTWHRAATSAVVASAIPNLTLLALGRLDLALYTSAGSLVALYAHDRPYAARARTLARVALVMLVSLAVALCTAALTEDVAVRVAVAALLAAGHKLAGDAARFGPPGNVIFTFVASSCAFVPQRLADVPVHVLLGLAGAVISWLVCMAPALVREDGPRSLPAALRVWTGDREPGTRAVLAELRWGSPLLPVATRVGVSAAAAGWLTMLLGVGRPYWAVVTAAAIFQANLVLTWRRALQRVLGNLLGLALFTALLPMIGIGPLALVLVALATQFAAEATMSRNYWLGSVFVTPMALTMVEFAGYRPAGELVGDRWLDTCVGAAVGLLGCVLITNRRASARVDGALDRLGAAVAETHALTGVAPGTAAALRDRVTAALADLRDAVAVAEGEWWQRALPAERVERAERAGRRALATLAATTRADREAA